MGAQKYFDHHHMMANKQPILALEPDQGILGFCGLF
jgi:hypothetical protein